MDLPHNKAYTKHDYLESMIQCCENALEFTKGMDQEAFVMDRYTKVAMNACF